MSPIVRILFVISILFCAPGCRDPDSERRQLPDFSLTGVTSLRTRNVGRADFLGKVWIVNFMFTRCHGPCPLNSAKMSRLQTRLPKEIKLATFTVDPKNDQAEALLTYAKTFQAEGDRWMFLTGPSEESLIPLFKDTFHTAYRKSAKSACGYETFHSAKFFLLDKQGVVQGEYDSADADQMDRLESDARALSTAGAVASRT